ncbi:hypothetical protein LEP1GSC163_1396 [Leptospira santarosai str. CBC379]|nr:hypothetical protein LEP1GSC163_1396 [Leptospira santarosai str. CBC379]
MTADHYDAHIYDTAENYACNDRYDILNDWIHILLSFIFFRSLPFAIFSKTRLFVVLQSS